MSLRFDFSTVCLRVGASVYDVLKAIDTGAVKIALVLESGKLVGVVTDGDLRRGILRYGLLNLTVDKIMRRNFRYITDTAPRNSAIAIMERENIDQIPVLDSEGTVVDLILRRELTRQETCTNPVVIMAGGMGKRLLPLTENCPKPMLEIGGKPLLERSLEQCKAAGLSNFYFAVNFLKDRIKQYFGDGSKWDVQIKYLEESEPMGTAGSLSLLPKNLDKPILIINGDILSKVDYRHLISFHNQNENQATVCVQEYNTSIPYGVVRTSGEVVVGFDEKPLITNYVNAGMYLLNPEMLSALPDNTFFDMPDLLSNLVDRGFKVGMFPVFEYWIEL